MDEVMEQLVNNELGRLAINSLPRDCDFQPRFLTMTGMFRAWLATHFGVMSNIQDPIVRESFYWTNDPKETRLAIEPVTEWRPDMTEQRPAILVKRSSWRSVKLGIDNRMIPKVSAGFNASPTQWYANHWVGGHVMFVLSRRGGEVESIATEVIRTLNQFAPKVREQLNMHQLVVAEAGEVGKLEEATENFVVPVSMNYALEESWTVGKEAPFLRQMDFSVLAN